MECNEKFMRTYTIVTVELFIAVKATVASSVVAALITISRQHYFNNHLTRYK